MSVTLQSPTADRNGVAVVCQALTKQFGDEVAVRDLAFEILRGTIFGFIGPSGSGKTTTVRLLTGIYEPTAGEARVLGQHPVAFTRQHRERIGYLPQLFVLYPDLTVWENLNLTASIYGMGLFRRKQLNQVLDFVELGDHRRKLARQLSGGMQRRLGLASTLVHNPELIFLDEPTAGIDPLLRQKFWDHFRYLRDQGRTLFITTQYVGEASHCDYVGILDEGRLIAADTPEGLRHRALGGEVVHLTASDPIDYGSLQAMRRLPFVRSLTMTGDTDIRLIVDEASEAMPALLEFCKAQNVAVASIEEYVPPFDDVFVELLRREPRHD